MDLPSSHSPPLSNLLPPTTHTPAPKPPWLGSGAAPQACPSGSTSPVARRLVSRVRRIVFTCVAVDWILLGLLPTPPCDDAVSLELSTFSWFVLCWVSHPAGGEQLDGALAPASGGSVGLGVAQPLTPGKKGSLPRWRVFHGSGRSDARDEMGTVVIIERGRLRRDVPADAGRDAGLPAFRCRLASGENGFPLNFSRL